MENSNKEKSSSGSHVHLINPEEETDKKLWVSGFHTSRLHAIWNSAWYILVTDGKDE